MRKLLIDLFGLDRLYKIRKSRVVNYLPRLRQATRAYNYRYGQILRWSVDSREDTNYTYALTDDSLLYLAHTVAVVSGVSPATVQAYFREVQTDDALRDYVLEKTRTSSYKRVADLRVEFGRRLGWYALVRIMKPGVVIETGVDKGLGAVLLCSALLRNRAEGSPGRYYGTDIAPKAGYLLDGIYKEVGQVLYGDSITSLKAFDQPIDLFINDSDHSATYELEEYKVVLPKLTPNGVLLSDNAHVASSLAQLSLEVGRKFVYYPEVPKDHWYPGAGIGFSFL
ncbi:class I SAM-dependent methyltransferase [Spirosoma rhododendri]|uniref:Class I SAM-dependent methyltransferase n=1 Tax=Spirosoma rhododendri TaxID=2728024 RepID=A0A7L5DGX7_9BACT|nr:class I SAM-dependent methyltransferase [Spirosoma rhododendri]QJD77479.1 class I SAM-dependent methyltransferase [Spirosoma rhododendri]